MSTSWTTGGRSRRLRALARFLDAGMDPARLSNLLNDKGLGSPMDRRHARVLAAALAQGATLVEALDASEGGLAPDVLAVLSAAERAGSLPDALRAEAERLERRRSLVRELLARSLYPLVLFHFATAAPEAGLLVRSPGGFAARVALLVLPLDALLVAGIALAWRRPRLLRRLAARIGPLDAALRRGELARALFTLRALYRAGVPLVDALSAAALAAEASAAPLEALGRRLADGESFATAVRATSALPGWLAADLATAYETGSLEEALARSAEVLADEHRRAVARWSRLAAGLLYAAAVLWAAYRILAFYSESLSSLSGF